MIFPAVDKTAAFPLTAEQNDKGHNSQSVDYGLYFFPIFLFYALIIIGKAKCIAAGRVVFDIIL